MKKIEKELKNYYLQSFKHNSQLEQIKRRTSFFEEKETNRKSTFFFKRFAPILCATSLVFIVTIGVVAISNNNPSSNSVISPISNRLKKSIVKIDSNPSITFTLNEEGIVTSIYGDNYDGKLILYEEDLVNKSYEEVIQTIIDREVECGYLLKNNNKYNKLNLKVYNDQNSSLDELEESIETYLDSKNIELTGDINVEETNNYEELLSSIYSYEKDKCTTFNEYYNLLENYYTSEGNAVSEIVEEFTQISYYYLDKLSYFKTIVDTINDATLYSYYCDLEQRINTYLNGYYNNFVDEVSSYNSIYKTLLEEKVALLENRIEEGFNLEKQEKIINECLEALEIFKQYVFDGILKPKLEKLNVQLEKIYNYVEKLNIKNFDKNTYENNFQEMKDNHNKKYNLNIANETIGKIKQQLIEFFK